MTKQTKAVVEQEYRRLKTYLASALEEFKEDGLYDSLCERGKYRFNELAKLSGANVQQEMEEATIVITLGKYQVPAVMSPEEYLEGIQISAWDADDNELDIREINVDYTGFEV